jgi:hypothetical protein
MKDGTRPGHSQHCLMGRNFTCERTALSDDVAFMCTASVNLSYAGLMLYFVTAELDYLQMLRCHKLIVGGNPEQRRNVICRHKTFVSHSIHFRTDLTAVFVFTYKKTDRN